MDNNSMQIIENLFFLIHVKNMSFFFWKSKISNIRPFFAYFFQRAVLVAISLAEIEIFFIK